MWTNVISLTSSADIKLGNKVASSVVLDQLVEPCFGYADYEKYQNFTKEVDKLVTEILNELIPEIEMGSAAKDITHLLFRNIACYIIYKAPSSPFFRDEGDDSIISSKDITWSINNLASTILLDALVNSFYEYATRCCQGGKCDFVNIKAILSPYLLEFEECSASNAKLGGCYGMGQCGALSCEGTLVLFNWIGKILTLTLNQADSMYLNSERKILCEDILKAFALMRHKLFCSFQKIDKMQNHGTVEKPLPNIPYDILRSHILPNLPLDAVLRFKSVSKEWKETISCPEFQSLLREHNEHDQVQSFGLFDYDGMSIKKTQKCDGLELMVISGNSPLNHSFPSFDASCSGFLCLNRFYNQNDKNIIPLGNPITGEWNFIQVPTNLGSLSKGPGLAVDLSRNPPQYRLVFLCSRDMKHMFGVYSSDTGEWKMSNAVLSEPCSINYKRDGNSVYINGLLYWVSLTKKLLWFDLDRDETGSIAWPYSDGRFYRYVLGNLEESGSGQMRLTCTIYSLPNGMVKTFKLVEENQWIELLSFSIEEGHDKVGFFPYMGGKIQYFFRNNSILSYDANTENSGVLLGFKFTYPEDIFPFKMNASPLPKCMKK